MTVGTEDLLGYRVCSLPTNVVLNGLEDALKANGPCRWLACINPHSYVVALSDTDFRDALHGADWLIPDGVGMVLASRLRSGTIKGRITGWDIFFGLHDRLSPARRGRVFLLGASEETLARMRDNLARDFPGLIIAGSLSPPYRPSFTAAETTAMIDAINASDADILWVAMTAPKQEKWLHAHAGRLNVRLAFAVGAVFDFYVGNVPRSSPVFQRLGLEWLPRLAREPRRLWRRTVISAPIFLFHLARYYLMRG